MLFWRSIIPVCVLTVAACAPSANLENEDANILIEMVVIRESPFHGCVMVRSPSALVAVYPADNPLPAMGNNFSGLEDKRAAEAARAIAVSFAQAMEQENRSQTLQVVGSPDNDSGECAMKVMYPQFSGDFAFVDFLSPGGDIGSYIFERRGSNWRVNQRIQSGWW